MAPANPEAAVRREHPDEKLELVGKEWIAAPKRNPAGELVVPQPACGDRLADRPEGRRAQRQAPGFLDQSAQAARDPAWRVAGTRALRRSGGPLAVERVRKERHRVLQLAGSELGGAPVL